MTPEQMARLRELAEAATAGRWHIYGGHNDYAIYSARGEEVEHVMNLDAYKMKPSLANAEWIAAAHPQAVLALLDAVSTLQQEKAALEADFIACRTERAQAIQDGMACHIRAEQAERERDAFKADAFYAEARAGEAEATTRRLEKELAVAEQEREAWMKEWARKGDRADKAKAEARRLREALARYGQHLPQCPSRVHWPAGQRCSCGLDAALAATPEGEK